MKNLVKDSVENSIDNALNSVPIPRATKFVANNIERAWQVVIGHLHDRSETNIFFTQHPDTIYEMWCSKKGFTCRRGKFGMGLLSRWKTCPVISLRLFAASMFFFSESSVSAPKNAAFGEEISFKHESSIEFPGFSIVPLPQSSKSPSPKEGNRFVPRQWFRIVTLDGQTLLKGVDLLPSGAPKKFKFRSSRRGFYEAEITLNPQRIKIQTVDSVVEPPADGSKSGRVHLKAEHDREYSWDFLSVLEFPAFSLLLEKTSTEKHTTQLTREDIDRWFEASIAAYAGISMEDKTRQSLLVRLQEQKSELERNKSVSGASFKHELRLLFEDGLEHKWQVFGHRLHQEIVASSKERFLVATRPCSEGQVDATGNHIICVDVTLLANRPFPK
jgi:hypothetical protein